MLVMMRLVAPGDVKPTAETWQLVAAAVRRMRAGTRCLPSMTPRGTASRELWTRIKRGMR